MITQAVGRRLMRNIKMLKQFNLQQLRFDDMVLTTDEDGQPIATTHGDGRGD